MELDDRKVKILKAIIKNYLETGEPVGSRTISKYADLKLSSATIRNEMADLEELGYIVQPHTSAGRIPTDKGYRFYVDDMMSQKETELVNREQVVTDREKEVESMQGILSQKVDKVEELLQNVAKVLAKDTNYATMVSAPQVKGNKLKFVQLSQLETNFHIYILQVSLLFLHQQMKNALYENPIPYYEQSQLTFLLNH